MNKKQELDQFQDFNTVWDVFAESPAEAENMRMRSELVRQISNFVEKRKLTHVEAAELCGVNRPRMTDLLNGKISKFSLDALVKIAANAGFSVEVNLKKKPSESRQREEEFA